jgi:hypothetical protein
VAAHGPPERAGVVRGRTPSAGSPTASSTGGPRLRRLPLRDPQRHPPARRRDRRGRGTLSSEGVTGGYLGLHPQRRRRLRRRRPLRLERRPQRRRYTPFRVFRWDNEADDPVRVINFSGGSDYRLGDRITVTGSAEDNSVAIWAPVANVKPDPPVHHRGQRRLLHARGDHARGDHRDRHLPHGHPRRRRERGLLLQRHAASTPAATAPTAPTSPRSRRSPWPPTPSSRSRWTGRSISPSTTAPSTGPRRSPSGP